MTLRTTKLGGHAVARSYTTYVEKELAQMEELSGDQAEAVLDYYNGEGYGREGAGSDAGRAHWLVLGDGEFCGVADAEAVGREDLFSMLSGTDRLGYRLSSPSAQSLSFLLPGDVAPVDATPEQWRRARDLASEFRALRSGEGLAAGLSVADAATVLSISLEKAHRLDLVMGGFAYKKFTPQFREVGDLLGGGQATVQEVLLLTTLIALQDEMTRLAERVDFLEAKAELSEREAHNLVAARASLVVAGKRMDATKAAAPERVLAGWTLVQDPSSAEGHALSVAAPSISALQSTRQKLQAVDATFSAPKSVSIMMALGTEQQANEIAGIQEAAVRSALKLAFTDVCFGRRGAEGIDEVKLEKMRAALITQFDSRTGDPQLHTHALLSCIAEMEDGGSSSIESWALIAASKNLGMFYHAAIRKGMTERFGVKWGESNGHGQCEIAGMPEELMAIFSGRKLELVEALPGFKNLTREERKAWKDCDANEMECELAAIREAEGWELTEDQVRLAALWHWRNAIEDRVYGNASAGQVRAAANTSRSEKTGLSEKQVRELAWMKWESQRKPGEELRPFELELHALLNLDPAELQRRVAEARAQVVDDSMLVQWLEEIQAEQATFGKGDLYRKILNETATRGVDPEQVMAMVERAFEFDLVGKSIRPSDRQGGFLSHAKNQGALYSTVKHQKLEESVAAQWARLSVTPVATGISDETIFGVVCDRILSGVSEAPATMEELEGQGLFAAQVLAGDSVLVMAAAGTGKSHVAKVTTPLLQQSGRLVIATAPSAVAAAELGEAAGADVVANTVLLDIMLRGGKITGRFDSLTSRKLAEEEQRWETEVAAGFGNDASYVAGHEDRKLRIKLEGRERKALLEKELWKGYGRLIAKAADLSAAAAGKRDEVLGQWSVKEIAADGSSAVLERRGDVDAGRPEERLTVTPGALAAKLIDQMGEQSGVVDLVKKPRLAGVREGEDRYSGAIRFTGKKGEKDAGKRWAYVGKGAAEIIAAHGRYASLDEDHPFVTGLHSDLAKAKAAEQTDANVKHVEQLEHTLATVTSSVLSERLDSSRVAEIVRWVEKDNLAHLVNVETQLGLVSLADQPVTIFVDEAGMIGTANLDALLSRAEVGQTQVVLMGDSSQLGSVKSAGGLFPTLGKQETTSLVVLDEIRRLVPDERKNPGVSVVREQKVQLALRELDQKPQLVQDKRQVLVEAAESIVGEYLQMDRVHASDTAEEHTEMMLSAYRDAVSHGETALIMCPDNHSTDVLNAAFAFEQRSWSDAVKGARAAVEAGIDGGVEDLAKLMAANPSTVVDGVEHHLYRELGEEPLTVGNAEFRAGELLMIYHNPRGRDRLTIKNGHQVELLSANADGGVTVRHDGMVQVIPGDSPSMEDLRLGFARTVHKSQGGTFGRAIVDMSLPQSWDREKLYVALSRGRFENAVYGVGELPAVAGEMVDAVVRTNAERSAMDVKESAMASRMTDHAESMARGAKARQRPAADMWAGSEGFDAIVAEEAAKRTARFVAEEAAEEAKRKYLFEHPGAVKAAEQVREEELVRQSAGISLGLGV